VSEDPFTYAPAVDDDEDDEGKTVIPLNELVPSP